MQSIGSIDDRLHVINPFFEQESAPQFDHYFVFRVIESSWNIDEVSPYQYGLFTSSNHIILSCFYCILDSIVNFICDPIGKSEIEEFPLMNQSFLALLGWHVPPH